MCNNYDADIPNNYPTVEPSSDYAEVSYDTPSPKDYYDVPSGIIESIGQAIIDAYKDDDDEDDD